MRAYYVRDVDGLTESRVVDDYGQDEAVSNHTTFEDAWKSCYDNAVASGSEWEYSTMPAELSKYIDGSYSYACYLVND